MQAFSKSTIQNKVILKDELESNKDRINFLFAEKDIGYNDFSSIHNIPHLSSDQIIGDTAEGQVRMDLIAYLLQLQLLLPLNLAYRKI